MNYVLRKVMRGITQSLEVLEREQLAQIVALLGKVISRVYDARFEKCALG